ncbi:hypothetical protein [Paracoccus homiensis]|uniref:Uncharacterized protein n=1 Tax=Paracoccus homiensis TaxID=364199 RepID=A0A1I0HVW2_9RHOB|nr:hypothetical protein [Paracoccus homiensis]SET88202.1 hypothetical protein SAMN04489858_11315 [Paracoccus homiensis]
MSISSNNAPFRIYVTAEDCKLIEAALAAYSHNAAYRDLQERLDQQRPVATIAQPKPLRQRADAYS